MSERDETMTMVIRGLITGIAREIAYQSGTPVKEPLCQHGAWYIAVGGFGLTCEAVGRAAGVSKQAVSEGCKRMADRCDDRALERQIIRVAETFGVAL